KKTVCSSAEFLKRRVDNHTSILSRSQPIHFENSISASLRPFEALRSLSSERLIATWDGRAAHLRIQRRATAPVRSGGGSRVRVEQQFDALYFPRSRQFGSQPLQPLRSRWRQSP